MSKELIDGMTEKEKLLLLEVLMRDMRGSFPRGWKDPRLVRASELAEELNLAQHKEWISKIEECSDFDGRHFRCSYQGGGYEGMETLHGLSASINDKSVDFQSNARALLEYPDCRFEDWKEL